MIAKYIDNKFYEMKGGLTPFLEEKGYSFYDFELELKEDGSKYEFYNQDGTPNLTKISESEKETLLREANSLYEKKVGELTSDVPESEKLTWTKQEQEARAYRLDSAAPTPLIDGIVESRLLDKDYLVGKIIEKADAYAIAVGKLTGERQATEDIIKA